MSRILKGILLVAIGLVVLFAPIWPMQYRVASWTINYPGPSRPWLRPKGSIVYGFEERKWLIGTWDFAGSGSETSKEAQDWIDRQPRFCSVIGHLPLANG